MVGADVQKYTVDSKASDAILSLRSSLNKVETMAKWLANQTDSGSGDPLTTVFGFTTDEAYLLRNTFEQLEAIRTNNTALWEQARKITGLE